MRQINETKEEPFNVGMRESFTGQRVQRLSNGDKEGGLLLSFLAGWGSLEGEQNGVLTTDLKEHLPV